MRRVACSLVVIVGLARPAAATPYETFIDVSDQQDLDDLLAAGDITSDTYEELLELLNSGVDLNTADRAELYTLPNLTYDEVDAIIAFREKTKGAITDPAVLVTAGAISQEKLLAISAFLILDQGRGRFGVRGWVRATVRGSIDDDRAPPWLLQGRFSAKGHLQAGFAVLFTRLDPGAPRFDPARDALIADSDHDRLVLPKIFIKYETDEGIAIAGTFRAGFGQRLVFDNSRRYTPNGFYIDETITHTTDLTSACDQATGELADSPCSAESQSTHITPDWHYTDGLFGAGAGFKHQELGSGWLQGYVWASARNRRVYQYELVDRGKCQDPSNDADPNCSAPPVFVNPKGSNALVPAADFKFQTLPDVFQERLAGVNVAYFNDRRNSVGVTAYGAEESNLISGINLDTQEWSSIPTGHKFGATGANFSFGRDWLDVFGEVAWSYDQLPYNTGAEHGGGGPAAILRGTATKKHQELEVVLRYYGVNYVNPYARPISQPDTLDGQRARDEAGIRVRYYLSDKRLTLRALADLWYPPSATDTAKFGRIQAKLDSYVRADFKTSDEIRLGLWMRYQDKDLERSGHDQCFEVSLEFDTNGEPIPCGGRQITTIARVQYLQNRTLHHILAFEYQLLDDPTIFGGTSVCTADPSKCGFRQDVQVWASTVWQPLPGWRIRGRVRYLNEDITANDRLEDSLAVLVDAAMRVRTQDRLGIRVDAKWWLDHRSSTDGDPTTNPPSLPRSPNPELQLWLSYQAWL